MKSKSELRKFGWTLGVAFLALGGLVWWRGHTTAAFVLAGVSAVMLLGGTLVPTWLGPVERAWMAMALAISKVTTPIFMGIVYYLVITPIGVLRKAFGGDPLAPQGSDDSYWVPHVTQTDAERTDMTRQF